MIRLILSALLLPVAAAATDGFDPASPDATFEGADPALADLDGLPLWDRIERHTDLAPVLFRQEDFAPGQAWADASELAPHGATLFGATEPHGRTFLLHAAPGWIAAPQPTPVLLVPGAGTNASGVLAVLARQLAADGKAVFAVSFSHPHGDCFAEAEQIRNALARVRALTGAERVDVVAHSKGGVSAAIFGSHQPGVDWGPDGSRGAAYEAEGTPYDGSMRRLVLVGAPLAGLDSAFRWTAPHAVTATADVVITPSAWSTYFPMTTASPLVSTDLADRDLLPDGTDAFPGQAQLLARFPQHALPGTRADLGVYAAQPDWLTTYEGGFGLWSDSVGIDAAAEAGGDVVARLGTGLDPSIELAVAAGTFPLLAVDRPAVVVDPLGGDFGAFVGQDEGFYADFFQAVLAPSFPDLELGADDVAGLRAGLLVPGEVSGLSDGVVFEASATATAGLVSRGAPLLEVKRFPLGHIDLLWASPELGAALVAQGEADPELRHLVALGQRYEADSVGWIAGLLADVVPGDDDDSADDDDAVDDDDDSADDDDDSAGDDDDSAVVPDVTGCGCATGGVATPWLLLLALRRRRCST